MEVKNKKQKIVISIIMLFFVISINSTIFAKYVIEDVCCFATLNIDRTAPSLQVSYSETKITKNDVVVTVAADEQIKPLDGWTISDDKKSISKIYNKNTTEPLKVSDLYDNFTFVEINVKNIDKEKPEIKLTNISNDNYNYENFANYKHHILISIDVIEKNIVQNNFSPENLQVYIDDEILNNAVVSIKQVEETESKISYEIDITNLSGNGELKLIIKDGIIIDSAGFTNEAVEINTQITIDNISPVANFEEVPMDLGKVQGKINLNEEIRNINGWENEINNLSYTKVFLSNVFYELNIYDYAGNESVVNINISNATYIQLTYCSHNSRIGWTDENKSNQVAGQAGGDERCKTEALAFNISGNIDNDFIKMRAYIYDYWKEGASGICSTNNILYDFGYNPGRNSWKSMASNDLVTMNGKKYFQFGGSNMNRAYQPNSNGENPIPVDIARQYLFGISAITMELKDYSDLAIVYQIYVSQVGWLTAKANGEEAVYMYDKPMSAIRMNIVPKTEKDDLIDFWNKNVN